MEQVHIGHYILGRTIGKGGFAKVKQARHDLTGIKVAIKILNKRKMRNKNMISKVKRQIKILRFIDHPNIIKLYQVLDTTNDIFVIMELAERGDLHQFMQNNQISQDQVKFLFKQIINGIGYAHFNLISHRDLKLQNILMDSNKIIKIVDFGLSNLMKDGKLLKTACGSINYTAPEILGQRKYEGTSVDIWSCGVILYSLLVGRLPFYEEAVTLLYRKIEAANYSIPSSINPMAADLISRMLQVDPFKRIRIQQIKNHPWIRPYIPIYSRIPLVYETEKSSHHEIDKEIFQQIKHYKYTKPLIKTQSRMRKAIRKKQDDSFVIAYQILKESKQQEEKAATFIKSMTETQSNHLILQKVKNIIVEKVYFNNIFQYGKRYYRSIKPLLHIVLQTLRYFDIEFSVKHEHYCLKCIYYNHLENTDMRKASRIKSSPQFGEDMEELGENSKIQKYSKKEIIFYLQIYTSSLSGQEHMIDLQLAQGHPLIFFNISSKIYKMIEKTDIN